MPRVIFEQVVVQHFDQVTTLPFCKYTSIRFFEVLFIREGSGLLKINNHHIPYSSQQLFVLIPNDEYTFEISTPTTISTIKFLNNFLADLSPNTKQVLPTEWFDKIETILSNNPTSRVSLQSEADQKSLHSLLTVLCNEYNDQHTNSDMVLKASLHALLNIVSRNVTQVMNQSNESKIQDILNYVHHHISDSEKLSRKALAANFHLSENYIGEFFKREMGISLKKYILSYKLRLVETRLKYTNLSVSEIAYELGFTDSSHLAKTFLSYKGVAMSTYRTNAKRANPS
jgi:YesN/AraC family two-component response regulator